MAHVAEDDNDWDLRDIALSKDVDMRARLFSDFGAMQCWCSKLSIQVLHKVGEVFWLALQGIDVLHAADENTARIAVLEATEIELSGKVRSFEV